MPDELRDRWNKASRLRSLARAAADAHTEEQMDRVLEALAVAAEAGFQQALGEATTRFMVTYNTFLLPPAQILVVHLAGIARQRVRPPLLV